MGPFETERLFLRQFQQEDWPRIYEIIYQDQDVYAMYSSLGGDEEAVRRRFEHVAHQPKQATFGRLAVLLKDGLTLVGQVHLDPHVCAYPAALGDGATSFNTVDVELAFAIAKPYWGQGYAFEACRRMIDYAFDGLKLPRLVGSVMTGNQRSIALHRRLGYRLVANPNQRSPVGWITVLENDRAEPNLDLPPLRQT